MPRKQTPSNPNFKPKKKGRQPAHQNTFAFRHNPKSKLTAKILSSPNVGLCRKCHDKIEWRKKYRKYKPLTQPATCNLCRRRNITAAYHTICDGCASSDLAHRKMMLAMAAAEGETGEVGVGAATSSSTNENDGDEHLKEEVTPRSNDVNSSSLPPLSSTESTAAAEATTISATTKRSCVIVCAMCVKEPAKKDNDDKNDIEAEIEEQVNAMEMKLKRPLKLRETKAIERKVQRAHEKEKERLKEERRRAREEEKEADKGEVEENNNVGRCGGEGNGEVFPQVQSDGDSVDSNINEETNDDDDDPFLNAIGGKDKLLTGDAYQRMMLEEEKRLSKIQISS